MSKDTSEIALLAYISVVLFFQLSVSFRKCNFMQYSLKQGLTLNPTLHCGHFNFVIFSSFFTEHIVFVFYQGRLFYVLYVMLG